MTGKVVDANVQGKLATVEKNVGQINTYMIGIVAVTAFGFITLLFTVISLVITYQHDNANAYEAYRDELSEQNDQIRDLKNEIKMMHGRDQ